MAETKPLSYGPKWSVRRYGRDEYCSRTVYEDGKEIGTVDGWTKEFPTLDEAYATIKARERIT